ncbi:hypothetical protein ATO13_09986 [Stappia sp. 22II-S9-Z10]|nr:hypothetical protein ATO13_09986 [Stappia sp. 22II-S9-Z10]
MPLGVGTKPPARFIQRGVQANGGQNILKRPSRRIMVERKRRRKRRQIEPLGQREMSTQDALILCTIIHRHSEAQLVGQMRTKGVHHPLDGDLIRARGDDGKNLPLTPFDEVTKKEAAVILGSAQVSDTEEAAQTTISSAVGRPDENVRGAVSEEQMAADECPQPHFLPGQMSAHHPGQRVAVTHSKT